MSTAKVILDLSEDKAHFRYILPGFSLQDVDLLQLDPYLKTWRIANMMYLCIEVAKRNGFGDFWYKASDQTYEHTHLTFIKAVSLNRLADLKDLEKFGSSPYQNDISVDCRISNIGNSSFQMNGSLSVLDTNKTLFNTTIIGVSVDRKTRKVAPHPVWWVEKYGTAARRRAADKVHLEIETEYNREWLVTQSALVIQPEQLDFYNHVNNAHFADFALNIFLKAQAEGKLSWTRRQIEHNIKYMVSSFLNPCVLHDRLVTALYKDPEILGKFYITFHKGTSPAYVQMLEYGEPN
ncbi:hypothetical protein LSH36_295g03088 [Paralvinella palmiformis]|uniref:Uncharacterized protein n=1 Tax=Paralvinella palmiformis TaxID=53620 RepID=A0AAD9N2W9_9ANNE|nr:hypothetical protein LSH36_295g03088 [Paralvinella palmiformis]